MTVPTRLAAFAALLLVVFGGSALAGAAIDPTDEPHGSAPHERPAGHGRTADRTTAAPR